MLKCFQLLSDALNQIMTLEQVLVPTFHKQIEAMLKSMSEAKVPLPGVALCLFFFGPWCVLLNQPCMAFYLSAMSWGFVGD